MQKGEFDQKQAVMLVYMRLKALISAKAKN